MTHLYRYANRKFLETPFVHFIVLCPECAQWLLHPMFNYVRVHREAFRGEVCALCGYLQQFSRPRQERLLQLRLELPGAEG
jgi:hypothetical protein